VPTTGIHKQDLILRGKGIIAGGMKIDNLHLTQVVHDPRVIHRSRVVRNVVIIVLLAALFLTYRTHPDRIKSAYDAFIDMLSPG
jgi:hypothetical protein